MNVIIVDDEPLAIEVIETYLSHFPELNLKAKCANAIEAFEALDANDIDLMFLDIQMPQISGIDFLKSLKNPPKVIFTTAFSNFAVEGFELNAVDYLLKPFSLERFSKAVQKFLEIHTKKENKTTLLSEEEPDYIFVKADKKLIKVRFEDIFYVEGLKDYVMLHTPTGRIVTLQTMKSLEEKLPSDIFIRVHRSYIVNLKLIELLEANSVLVNKKKIPIGKNYKDELLNVINQKRL
jgi:DNA-binding LytR/AlgR family response regulator